MRLLGNESEDLLLRSLQSGMTVTAHLAAIRLDQLDAIGNLPTFAATRANGLIAAGATSHVPAFLANRAGTQVQDVAVVLVTDDALAIATGCSCVLLRALGKDRLQDTSHCKPP